MIAPWFTESFYGDCNLHVTFLRFMSSGIEEDFLPRPISVVKVPPAGDLICLDVATGKVVWQKSLVHDYGVKVPLYGFASPPLVDGQRLITVVGDQNQAVVALDRHTGKELWKAGSASEPGYSARCWSVRWAAIGNSLSGSPTP